MRGSIAERGGVRVGHRIIEINNESVVATTHQHIVELLATTVGEVSIHPVSLMCSYGFVGLFVFCLKSSCLSCYCTCLSHDIARACHMLLHLLITWY